MLSRKPLLDKGLYAGITSFMLLFAGQAKSATEQQINDPAPAWDHLWFCVSTPLG